MLGVVDIAETSASEPGQGGSISPYCSMKSLYFDDSLYENEMHYKISKYLDEYPLDDDHEELVIKCDNEVEYNSVLDALCKASEDKFIISGVSNNPMEIIVERDVRDGYRQFDEKFLVEDDKQ